MGIEVNLESLTARVYGYLKYEVRERKQQWRQEAFQCKPNYDIILPCCTMKVRFGRNKTLPNFPQLFGRDDKLKAAMSNGIKESYPEFSTFDSRPDPSPKTLSWFVQHSN